MSYTGLSITDWHNKLDALEKQATEECGEVIGCSCGSHKAAVAGSSPASATSKRKCAGMSTWPQNIEEYNALSPEEKDRLLDVLAKAIGQAVGRYYSTPERMAEQLKPYEETSSS